MLNPSDFRELVSGRRRGVLASVGRCLLRIAETPYTWAVTRRNRQFDSGRREVHRIAVPVISVGNLTLGGTGKTPMVEWLCRWFRQRDVRVCIISRGYKAEEGGRNDEAIELEQKLPDVPHVQNPDRVAAAQMAAEEFATQLIVLDDAFQHRRIHRDLDIVLLDALEPFGFEHVFPRGTLREPLAGLKRAHVVALSRADMLDRAQRDAIRARVATFAPAAIWLEVTHAPRTLANADGEEAALSLLAGKRVAAFCGIGNPAGFWHTLRQCGVTVAAQREFPDHHNYSRDDIEGLSEWISQRPELDAVVCTQKDLVKIGLTELAGRPLWAVTVGLDVLAGGEPFEQQLELLHRTAAAIGD